MKPISESRFNALAYKPMPALHAVMYREVEWYELGDERLLGAVVLDLTDRDYSFVVLVADAAGAYRAADFSTSFPTVDAARQALASAMLENAARSDGELRAAQDTLPGGLTEDEHRRVFDVLVERERYLPPDRGLRETGPGARTPRPV